MIFSFANIARQAANRTEESSSIKDNPTNQELVTEKNDNDDASSKEENSNSSSTLAPDDPLRAASKESSQFASDLSQQPSNDSGFDSPLFLNLHTDDKPITNNFPVIGVIGGDQESEGSRGWSGMGDLMSSFSLLFPLNTPFGEGNRMKTVLSNLGLPPPVSNPDPPAPKSPESQDKKGSGVGTEDSTDAASERPSSFQADPTTEFWEAGEQPDLEDYWIEAVRRFWESLTGVCSSSSPPTSPEGSPPPRDPTETDPLLGGNDKRRSGRDPSTSSRSASTSSSSSRSTTTRTRTTWPASRTASPRPLSSTSRAGAGSTARAT